MKVYGADFSGARNPSRGIYFAEGILGENSLIINRIFQCDDRLDLLSAIHSSRAPWGLDFPFSLSIEAQNSLQVQNWSELLTMVVSSTREDFELEIETMCISSCEGRCREHSICCRKADATINSFSSLKKNNPNMRAMSYAGLKLLYYLRSFENTVYPFDKLDQRASRLYEVYPSHTWKQLGLSRSTNLEEFVKRFNEIYDFEVDVKEHFLNVNSIDAADAAVACITLGYTFSKCNLDENWNKKYPWISTGEWNYRLDEGIIVKISF